MASMNPKKSSLPPPKSGSSASPPPAGRRPSGGLIVIAAIVVIAVVAAIVVALTVGGGGDDDDTVTGSIPPLADVVKPVAVDGAALPAYTEAMINGEEDDAAVGVLAPIVSGVDYEGNPVTIDAAANGPTMVILLAHWCPHCNAEIPRLNEWRDAGDVPDDLDIVGVSTGIDPTRQNYPPAQWLVARDWQWSVLADSDLGADTDPDQPTSAFRAYGGQYFPTAVIIGSDGRVLSRFSGEPSVEEIDELVTTALAADPGAA